MPAAFIPLHSGYGPRVQPVKTTAACHPLNHCFRNAASSLSPGTPVLLQEIAREADSKSGASAPAIQTRRISEAPAIPMSVLRAKCP